MASITETAHKELRASLEHALQEFSNEEAVERQALRSAWRKLLHPRDGEIFARLGSDGPLCLAALLPGPAPQAALVAIWFNGVVWGGEQAAKPVGPRIEVIGAARQPDLPVKVFKIFEAWRKAVGTSAEQIGRSRWSGLENPVQEGEHD